MITLSNGKRYDVRQPRLLGWAAVLKSLPSDAMGNLGRRLWGAIGSLREGGAAEVDGSMIAEIIPLLPELPAVNLAIARAFLSPVDDAAMRDLAVLPEYVLDWMTLEDAEKVLGEIQGCGISKELVTQLKNYLSRVIAFLPKEAKAEPASPAQEISKP